MSPIKKMLKMNPYRTMEATFQVLLMKVESAQENKNPTNKNIILKTWSDQEISLTINQLTIDPKIMVF